MIKIRRKCKEIERKSFRAKTKQKQSKNRAKTRVCEISQPLRNQHFAAKPFRNLKEAVAKSMCLCESGHPLRNQFCNSIDSSTKIFAAAKPSLAHECHFTVQEPPFHSCEMAAKL